MFISRFVVFMGRCVFSFGVQEEMRSESFIGELFGGRCLWGYGLGLLREQVQSRDVFLGLESWGSIGLYVVFWRQVIRCWKLRKDWGEGVVELSLEFGVGDQVFSFKISFVVSFAVSRIWFFFRSQVFLLVDERRIRECFFNQFTGFQKFYGFFLWVIGGGRDGFIIV